MRRKMRRGCALACSAFASEPSTLLAQWLIALLSLSIGLAAMTRLEAGKQPVLVFEQASES